MIQTSKVKETLSTAAGGNPSFDVCVLEDSTEQDVTLNEYDGFNQLKKVTTGGVVAEYEYNMDGLRVSKTVNGNTTRHVWDGQNIALELDSSNNVTAKYVRGINLIRNDTNYYMFNGHGDVVQLSDSTGAVVKNYDYDAFGVEKNPAVNDTNVFRYCGEYWDKETGTYYLRARYYNPTIGRFISEDSNWGKINDPLSLNLYTYCGNNPIIFIDPSGHNWLKPDDQTYQEAFVNAYKAHQTSGNILYDEVNFWTLGIPDTLKGTFNPEKPLSLEHWVDSTCTVILLIPVTQAISKGEQGLVSGGKGLINKLFGKGTTNLGRTSETQILLDNMPELTGTNREKLLSVVQSDELSSIVNELYRPGATIGDGGTADALVQEFYSGSSKHLQKAGDRLSQLNNLVNNGNLNLNDLDIAESLITDLENAINLFD